MLIITMRKTVLCLAATFMTMWPTALARENNSTTEGKAMTAKHFTVASSKVTIQLFSGSKMLVDNVTEMMKAGHGNQTSDTPDTNKYDSAYHKEDWIVIFDSCQLAAMSVGIIANIVTVFALNKNGEAFTPVISLLVRHQSIIDIVVCILGMIILAQPPMWTTGDNVFSMLVCQVWHGQFIFWVAMFVSIYNLALISLERYLAVCRPFKHADFTPSTAKKCILGIYCFVPIGAFLCFFQVYYTDGKCLSEYYFKTEAFKHVMKFYGFYAFATLYAIPCAIFFIMYGLVVVAFIKRKGQTDQLGTSRVLDKAATELTKTAIVVTGFFIVALGYDLWYYLLGHMGLVVYLKSTPLQKVGMFLAAMNSCANPFIYAMFMPAYRVAVRKTLMCVKKGDGHSVP